MNKIASTQSHAVLSELFILHTDIQTRTAFTRVRRTLMKIPGVFRCTIDLDDCDRVLRVECNGRTIDDIIREVRELGFHCRELEG